MLELLSEVVGRVASFYLVGGFCLAVALLSAFLGAACFAAPPRPSRVAWRESALTVAGAGFFLGACLSMGGIAAAFLWAFTP